MGVAGLWEVLRPAGQVRSLTELAVEDGFNANPARQRGFRIGIDASIWFFHAACGREGENPELRTLFFRCCRLLQSPLLPLFVFDGPNRPAIKRGKRVGGNAHWLTQGMKNIIDAFGFEWWVAPGEAEAELAYLNRIGIIDAVLSDDVDNFLFGATMVIRNPSNTLSGNRAHPVKNAQGKDDGNHVVTYTANSIRSDPSVSLSRPGIILIGLLSGGDYIPAGLPGCGQKFATGLARAGFGDSLMKAIKEIKGSRLDAFLDQWRRDIRNELKTNASGLLPSKKPSLAASLPDDFPSLPVLMSYADPLTSENTPQKDKRKTPLGVWRSDPDPMRVASLCELYFEWGVKDIIIHRFRTVLWPGIVCRAVRRAVVKEDTRRHPAPDGAHHAGSGEHDDDDIPDPSSPTKRISSALSTLVLSSPPKKSSTSGTSAPDPSESFALSSLCPLTLSAPPSSLLPVSSSSPTSSTSRPSPLLLEVLSERTHASTDSTLEYRVLIDPTVLVERAESGVRGIRPPLVGGLFGIDPEDEDASTVNQDADESGSDGTIERLETAAVAASKSGTRKRKARRENPTTPLRLWLPACMVRAAAPALAKVYEANARSREEKRANRRTKGERGGRVGTGIRSTSRGTKVKGTADNDGNESVRGPSSPKIAVGPQMRTKVRGIGRGGGRRKPKQAAEAQDDVYEFFDLSAGESPCSSDGESVKESTKGKRKERAKMGKTNNTRLRAKAGTKATDKNVAAANTMTQFFNTTKPSATRAIRSKQSTSRSSAAKTSSTLNLAASKCVYEEEEEGSADATIPLPRSSRPLDLLRAKSKFGAAVLNPTSKSKSKATAVSRYEEEESSPTEPPPGEKPNASSLPCLLSQPASQARKKALFVDVSDSDSDIDVNYVPSQLSDTTTTIAAYSEVGAKAGVGNGYVIQSVSAGVGKISSTSASKKSRGGTVGGVIDLTPKGKASRPKSTLLMPVASHPPVRPPVSAFLGTDTDGPTPTAHSPSELAHTFLPQPRSALESQEEEEGNEGNELPTFHRGSAKTRTQKASARIVRPALRPFPMQLASNSPESPYAWRSRERDKSRHDDKNDGSDEIEIVDVFTTPRGPSPPRSPVPNSSPVYASRDSAKSVRSNQSSRFPPSPIRCKFHTDAEPHKKVKQCCHTSSDCDAYVSGNERNEMLKSPRKSATHSSPRHASLVHGRALSPTPSMASCSAPHATNTGTWTRDMEGCNASDSRQLQLEDPGSAHIGDSVGRKSRPSDAFAIYISSGSEDESNKGLGTNDSEDGGEGEGSEDQDACTDFDVDGWADTGMILSVPPSSARVASRDLEPTAPVVEVALLDPGRASKFKPAPAAVLKVDARALPAECQVSDGTASTRPRDSMDSKNTAAPRPVHRTPLLVARAKRNKDRKNEVIGLTSD